MIKHTAAQCVAQYDVTQCVTQCEAHCATQCVAQYVTQCEAQCVTLHTAQCATHAVYKAAHQVCITNSCQGYHETKAVLSNTLIWLLLTVSITFGCSFAVETKNSLARGWCVITIVFPFFSAVMSLGRENLSQKLELKDCST